jgi:hypothetical protein
MQGWMSGKKWLFFAMFPIGVMFHVSAAIVLLFPFANFKVSWKTLIIAFVIALGIWLFSDLLLGRVMMAVLGGMGAMVQKVLFYSLQASTIFGFLRSAITYLIFPFIIMFFTMQAEVSEEKRKRMERMIAFMVILGVLASAFAGFVRVYNYARVFYLILMADFVFMLFRQKKHLLVRVGTLMGTLFLIALQYMIPYKTTNTYYYDYFYPYTCILDEDKGVFIREVAHAEAVEGEVEDNNVREIE